MNIQFKPDGTPVIDFLDPKVQANPFPAYKALHERQPVYQMPGTGFYMITRYEDVREVLRDTETFSSNVVVLGSMQSAGGIQQSLLKEKGWQHVQTLQRTDPPVHTRYRKLLNRVFTGPRVQALAPRIEHLVEELIDTFIDKGNCEFVNDFALPLPGIVIAEQIGLDPSEIHTFKKWADAMLAGAQRPLTEEEMRQATETEIEAQHHLAKVFEDRRKAPREDIISGLVHSHGEDEEPLSIHELQNLMHQLITGGYETTTSALCHGVWLLIRHPELADQLRSNSELVDKFVEESLRYESPVQGLFRQTTRDVTVSGTIIPKDSVVIVRFGAANRDEMRFEDAGTLNINRADLGTHLAFGAGVHRCIGAVLAREELRSAYRMLTKRLKNIRLKHPDAEPQFDISVFLYPIAKMHIEFDRAD